MNKVLSDERLGAKLRVTENRCVLFDSFTYIYIYIHIYTYIYIYIYIYIYHINSSVIQGFPALRKAVKTREKIWFFFTCVDIANQLLIRYSPLVPLGQVDE